MKKGERERTPFGKRLLDAREKRGIKQDVAALAVGISQSTLSGLEKAANGSSKVAELARLYGCSAYYLATGESVPDASGFDDETLALAAKYQSMTPEQRAMMGDLYRVAARDNVNEPETNVRVIPESTETGARRTFALPNKATGRRWTDSGQPDRRASVSTRKAGGK